METGRYGLLYLEGVDYGEVIALGVSGQGLPPHVCHLLFALHQSIFI